MKKLGKKKLILSLCALCLAALAIWTAWGNKAPEVNTYSISSAKLPEGLDGYRIAQVSDLHNTEFGKGNEKLLSMLKAAQPDIIAITGDMIDSRKTDIDIALSFAAEAVKIAPCYYVSGNHEARVEEYGGFKAELASLGVTVLEGEAITLATDGGRITLLGVDDPSFYTAYLFGDPASYMSSALQELTDGEEAYTVLLSHRPELFEVYVESGVDLVLSGHAHGGQFRLPFVGGLVAPNQGFFPRYDAGLFTEENTNMIVSRGLGNSLFPFRFNNRPEIVVAELTKA